MSEFVTPGDIINGFLHATAETTLGVSAVSLELDLNGQPSKLTAHLRASQDSYDRADPAAAAALLAGCEIKRTEYSAETGSAGAWSTLEARDPRLGIRVLLFVGPGATGEQS